LGFNIYVCAAPNNSMIEASLESTAEYN
jgi:hypothetical protein